MFNGATIFTPYTRKTGSAYEGGAKIKREAEFEITKIWSGYGKWSILKAKLDPEIHAEGERLATRQIERIRAIPESKATSDDIIEP